jgi:Protein of unknown function (DUF2973)
MWLHIIYTLAFTTIAILAIGNLIRSILTLGVESQRPVSPRGSGNSFNDGSGRRPSPQHPEMLDENGRVINEPLLVMRSMSMDDARERLDAIYRSSPGGESGASETDSN